VFGNSQPTGVVATGSLSAHVYAKATTNTLVITPKWQVSNDGSTWFDAYGSNRAAAVAMVTGTGSAVTDTIALSAPEAVYQYKFARVVLTSTVGGGGGVGVDEASVSYSWRQFLGMP